MADELDFETLVIDATTVELLMTCKARLETELAASDRDSDGGPSDSARRDLSLAITHIEDAITRANWAHYRRKGTFEITDAER